MRIVRIALQLAVLASGLLNVLLVYITLALGHLDSGFYGTHMPFTPTLVVGIDDVAEKKWKCISAMPSQFGDKDSWQARTLPNVPQSDGERQAFLLDIVKTRASAVANQYRDRLVALYGKERGEKIKYAEAFQLSQYGRQASIDELKAMFPTFH